jgi:hypothetical protein
VVVEGDEGVVVVEVVDDAVDVVGGAVEGVSNLNIM